MLLLPAAGSNIVLVNNQPAANVCEDTSLAAFLMAITGKLNQVRQFFYRFF